MQWSWGLDDFSVEDNQGTVGNADVRVQKFTANLVNHCLDVKNMVVDLADGVYVIRSVAGDGRCLITADEEGAQPAAALGEHNPRNPQDTSKDRWTIRRCDPIVQRALSDRATADLAIPPPFAVVGAYKAASDVWYQIRYLRNGGHLIVGCSGNQGGRVEVYKDPQWPSTPKTQLMWRLWRLSDSHNTYVVQNVCSGQLLGVIGAQVQGLGKYCDGGELEERDPSKLWTLSVE